MRYHKGCLIHKYTYLLDDGRDVAVVLLHGLGVLVVLEGRHGGAARSPAPRSHAIWAVPAGAFCLESRTKGPVDIGGRLGGIPVGAVRVPLSGEPCPTKS